MLLASVAIALLTLLIYIPVYFAPAHWDDPAYLVDNFHLRSWHGLYVIWFKPEFNWQYYPVVFTSFWIEHHLWGATLWPYHVVNAAFHAANAILLMAILRRLKVPAAFLIALIFACHPIHVETVTYIAERKNLFSCFFFMLAMFAYWRFADGPAKNRWWAYAGAMVSFILAIQSKTVVAVFPFIMLLVLFYQRRRITLRDVWPLIPFVLVAIPQGMIVRHLEQTKVGAWGEPFQLNPVERVLIAGRCLWFYVGKILWPYPLIPIYERWAIDPHAAWQYLYPAAYAALTGALVALRKKIGEGPWILAAAFFLILAPALGFVSYYPMIFSYVSDHFVYLGSVPAIMAFVLLARWILQKVSRESQAPMQISATVLMLILTGLTVSQGLLWQSYRTIWYYNFLHNQDAAAAQANLANALEDEGELDAAKLLFEKALSDREVAPNALDHLAQIATKEGRHQDAANYAFELGRLNPRSAAQWVMIGDKLRYVKDYEKALVAYNHATQLAPTQPGAFVGLAQCFEQTGDRFKAALAAKMALDREPDNQEAKRILTAMTSATAAAPAAPTPAKKKAK